MSTHATAVEAVLADWATRDRAAALRLFVPEARSPAASARIALGHTLRDSAWMGSDARVIEAKSAWWLEELALTTRGQPRHPLTCFLAEEATPPDFAALSREFARLRSMALDEPTTELLAVLGLFESMLWFGAATPDHEACTTRAHAALIDILERSGRYRVVGDRRPAASSIAAAHALALRAAPSRDRWTAARRAQALRWLEAPSDSVYGSRWREVLAVWTAVQTVRWRGRAPTQSGAQHGI